MKNKDKILEVLKKETEPITASDLADKSNIAFKNIGRYLKELESENKIKVDFKFEGNTRYKNITLIKEKLTSRKLQPKPKVTPAKVKKIETPKIAPKKAPKTVKIQTKITKHKKGYNQSLELNLIKGLYANHFNTTTTNELKGDMMQAIVDAWRNDGEVI